MKVGTVNEPPVLPASIRYFSLNRLRANAVISNNFDRKDKKLWTDVGAGDPIIGFTGYSQHDEAQFVADEIEALPPHQPVRKAS